ncbi:O-antigen polysaccharide polymerase Wzy [Bacteroides uniformis]|uniref:O-antigen polysaccharide polymerase Wzy n=1 Tax=Bacteroides uniformis TaxID=820 RepID=UPI00202EFF0B|nr:O-antigen polysaccharide polymerase Wzy [Bacteroides uniformis]MCM1955739.1 O-antigen polysaccharide polymerase Wzy [Bacteroides uniformis]
MGIVSVYTYLQACFSLYFLLLQFFAPDYLDIGYICSVLVGVLGLLSVHYYGCYITKFDRRVVSIRNLFVVFYVIVYFQYPLDYLLGYNVSMTWIYRTDIFCGALNFSALCLSLFLLGYSLLSVPKRLPTLTNRVCFPYVWPFVVLAWVCFFLFILRMGFSFFMGGYGAEGDGSTIDDDSGARFFNYLQLCLKIVTVMVVWNHFKDEKRIDSIKSYLNLFPLSFVILYFSIVILWFTAGGRAVSITLILFFFCGYFILSKKDIPFFYAFILVIVGGLFFSLFKIMGGLTFSHYEGVNIMEAISRGYDFYQSYNENASLFVPTRELSFSMYTYDIYYYWWNTGNVYGGLFLLLSIVGAIPGLTPVLSQMIGIDLNYYYLAKIVTDYDAADRGLGSSCVGELLCDVGFSVTLLLFFLIGILLRKLDTAFLEKHGQFSLLLFILVFSYLSTVFFAPRGSLLSGISSSIFIYILLRSYALVVQRASKRKHSN